MNETQEQMITRLRETAAKYLSATQALEAAHRALRDARMVIDTSGPQLEALRKELAASVQPACGSADQPPRRIFSWGERKVVVVVEWDHTLAQPVVSIETAL